MQQEKDPVLVSLGGGVKDVEVRTVDTKAGTMVIVHLLVDTGTPWEPTP